ncbi:hypothetical protein WMY93_011291 [Mugilogobius chulae]|uniref:Uncharacterized protein n=1 Tax=Mugilogobius chulae TaxID=88201 RepID=A0AAW0P274_9GOBI
MLGHSGGEGEGRRTIRESSGTWVRKTKQGHKALGRGKKRTERSRGAAEEDAVNARKTGLEWAVIAALKDWLGPSKQSDRCTEGLCVRRTGLSGQETQHRF